MNKYGYFENPNKTDCEKELFNNAKNQVSLFNLYSRKKNKRFKNYY